MRGEGGVQGWFGFAEFSFFEKEIAVEREGQRIVGRCGESVLEEGESFLAVPFEGESDRDGVEGFGVELTGAAGGLKIRVGLRGVSGLNQKRAKGEINVGVAWRKGIGFLEIGEGVGELVLFALSLSEVVEDAAVIRPGGKTGLKLTFGIGGLVRGQKGISKTSQQVRITGMLRDAVLEDGESLFELPFFLEGRAEILGSGRGFGRKCQGLPVIFDGGIQLSARLKDDAFGDIGGGEIREGADGAVGAALGIIELVQNHVNGGKIRQGNREQLAITGVFLEKGSGFFVVFDRFGVSAFVCEGVADTSEKGRLVGPFL